MTALRVSYTEGDSTHACLRKAAPTERAGVSGGKVSVRTVTRTLGLVGGAIPQSPRDGVTFRTRPGRRSSPQSRAPTEHRPTRELNS